MREALKIIIVEDHKGFSEALTFFLTTKLKHRVIFVAHSAKEFFEYENINRADVILMDIELPDENGIQIAKKVLWQYSSMKIIAMTMYEDKVYLTKIISAGFKAALFKSDFYKNIKNVLETVMNNKIYFPKRIKL